MNVVSAWHREGVLQAVDKARHRLGLRHHLHCWIVDPKAVIYISAGDLELDGLADDEIGSFDRPGPLRARRTQNHARSSLRRTVGIGQGPQGGRGCNRDDCNQQPEPPGAQTVSSTRLLCSY